MASQKAPVLGKTTKADLPGEIFGEEFHHSLVHEAARADANARAVWAFGRRRCSRCVA